MKGKIEVEINKLFESIDIEGYRNNVIAQIIAQYRDKIMNQGWDVGAPGMFRLEKYLRQKVAVVVTTTLTATKKELDEVVKA